MMTKTRKWMLAGLCLILTFALAFVGLTSEAHAENLKGESLAFLKTMTASRGTLTSDTEKVVFTITGENSYVQSRNLAETSGSPFYARLYTRNTIVVHMKNETQARAMKVSFKTSSHKNFTADTEESFVIEPHSAYKTYYFNLSKNVNAEGTLTGFRLSPVGATSGKIEFKGISFEIEDALYEYAGEIRSCTATKELVTIEGTLSDKFTDSKVNLYATDVTNLKESVEGLTPIASSYAKGKNFTITLPFYGEDVSYLSSRFIVVAQGVKVSKAFVISNYADFSSNPYQFSLPTKEVKVSEYGALGDGFNDDTKAIQKAIDAVALAGGGRVVIEGDECMEGKRYIVTNLNMKSHVELHIAKNAVLWQSRRAKDYAYEVGYGHDIVIEGAYWTHSALCKNYPLIYGTGLTQIKITGEGTIRMADSGADSLYDYGNMQQSCTNRIHLVPIGLYHCDDIEIRDITIVRNSSYHIACYDVHNVYIGNVTMTQVVDVGGDGISLGSGAQNIKIDRCQLYVTDDAVVLWSTSAQEKRGTAWWQVVPNKDNRVKNIEIVRSFITGGHGVTFITWGTDALDLSKQEISDIVIEDNILAKGGNTAIAGWFDNPYYGSSTASNGFAGENGDYSSVKNVTVLHNKIYGYATFGIVPITNLVSDCMIASATQFSNANFERSSCQQKVEENFISGLSYWSTDHESAAKAVKVNEGYAGEIDLGQTSANLYQSFYLNQGTYTLQADTKSDSVGGKLAVWSAENQSVLAETAVNLGEFVRTSVIFTVVKSGYYRLGIDKGTATSGKAYIDNVSFSGTPTSSFPTFFTEDFVGKPNETLVLEGFEVSGGKASTIQNGINASIKLAQKNYAYFDLVTTINLKDSTSLAASSFIIRLNEFQYESNYIYYEVEYHVLEKKLTLSAFKTGVETVLATHYDFELSKNVRHEFAVVCKDNELILYVDGSRAVGAYDIADVRYGKGYVTLKSHYLDMEIQSLSMSQSGTFTGIEPVYDEFFKQNFESEKTYFDGYDWKKETISGNMVLTTENENAILKLPSLYSSLDFKFDFFVYGHQADSKLSVKLAEAKGKYYVVEIDWVKRVVNVKKWTTSMMTLKTAKYVFDDKQWYTIGFSLDGGVLNVYINGESVLTCRDATSPYIEGKVSLNMNQTIVALDNIEVGTYGTLELGTEKNPDNVGSGGGCGKSGALLLLMPLLAFFSIKRR